MLNHKHLALAPHSLAESHSRRRLVRESLFANDSAYPGPFGEQPFLYFDGTATGSPSRIIYEASRHLVQHRHGNSHGKSAGGLSALELFHGSFHAIRTIIGASEQDLLWLTGSGATGAVHKFLELLGAKHHSRAAEVYGWNRADLSLSKRPLFITSLKEHHSNDLPFAESVGELRYVGFCEPTNDIDLDELEMLLKAAQAEGRPYVVVSIQGASNVDGSQNDMSAIARLAHRYGAYVGFDLATHGSHRPIQARPGDDSETWPDFLFYSSHKLVGMGLDGNPGMLYVSERLLRGLDAMIGEIPVEVGGDTVIYTSAVPGKRVGYISDKHYWIGGSDNIGGAVRAALGLILREWVGWEAIEAQERKLGDTMLHAFEGFYDSDPPIGLLGSFGRERLPVFSFTTGGVRYTPERVIKRWNYLDHRLASLWLQQHFGLQLREGCACAGKYGARLLGIPLPVMEKIIADIQSGNERSRPGWVRATVDWTHEPWDVADLIGKLDEMRRSVWAIKCQYRQQPDGSFALRRPGQSWWSRFDEPYDAEVSAAWNRNHRTEVQGFLNFARGFFGI